MDKPRGLAFIHKHITLPFQFEHLEPHLQRYPEPIQRESCPMV